MKNNKKVRNPFGKKGKEDHQNLIRIIFNELLSRYKKVVKEDRINLKNGKKRFSDMSSV